MLSPFISALATRIYALTGVVLYLNAFVNCPRVGRLLCAITCMGLVSTVALADELDGGGSTGLIPPTEEHVRWMSQNAIKTRSVALNAIGVARANVHLQSRGLAARKNSTVSFGQEVTADVVTLLEVGAIPRSVDNSTLPSFPPVRSQGSLGSCASFSTVYYMGTHLLGLKRGYDNRDNYNDSTKLSPKWTYNLVNGGENKGSWFTSVMDVMLKNGVATWADFPYVGDKYEPRNYREWSVSSEVWRRALLNRFDKLGQVEGLDSDNGLNNLKALLLNGYVCVFATNISGWHFYEVSDDPSTREDDQFRGQAACGWVSHVASGHAMTVVGFNDDI